MDWGQTRSEHGWIRNKAMGRPGRRVEAVGVDKRQMGEGRWHIEADGGQNRGWTSGRYNTPCHFLLSNPYKQYL